MSRQDNAIFVEQSFSTESCQLLLCTLIFWQMSWKLSKTPCETSSLLHASHAVYLKWRHNNDRMQVVKQQRKYMNQHQLSFIVLLTNSSFSCRWKWYFSFVPQRADSHNNIVRCKLRRLFNFICNKLMFLDFRFCFLLQIARDLVVLFPQR